MLQVDPLLELLLWLGLVSFTMNILVYTYHSQITAGALDWAADPQPSTDWAADPTAGGGWGAEAPATTTGNSGWD